MAYKGEMLVFKKNLPSQKISLLAIFNNENYVKSFEEHDAI